MLLQSFIFNSFFVYYKRRIVNVIFTHEMTYLSLFYEATITSPRPKALITSPIFSLSQMTKV